MHPKFLIAILVGLAATPALAAPPARTFDRVTYTPPERWKVDETASGRVSISRIGGDSYCMVVIYSSMPASGDLEASFAASWQNVALRTVAPVAAPTPTQGSVGNARAVLGGAASTAQGRPVAAILIVLDAGASVVPILILTPSTEAFDAYSSDVQAMLAGLVVSRADAAPAPSPPSGKPVVPPPTRPITLADLAGEWKHEDGIMTRYVDRNTGAYAGFDSIAFRETWTITAKGVVQSDFFAIKNGRKIIDKNTGSMRVSAGRILEVKIGSPAKFVVRGWLEGPEMTVLKICGPFYGDVPADVLANPEQGSNLNQYWVRKAK